MNPFKTLNPTVRSVAAEYLAKVWMLVAVVFIAINLFVVLTLLQVAPKLTVIPQVLTSPMDSQEFIQAEPFSANISDKKLIDEMLVRYYLDMRLSELRDPIEMARRWSSRGPVAVLSSPAVYAAFANQGKDKTLADRLKAVQSQPFTVGVHVTNISRWDNTFVIDFDLIQYANGSVSVKHKSVTMEVRFYRSRAFLGKNAGNPYGMTVVTYTERNKNQ